MSRNRSTIQSNVGAIFILLLIFAAGIALAWCARKEWDYVDGGGNTIHCTTLGYSTTCENLGKVPPEIKK